MPKKSTKSKSKRVGLKQKYKVIKKVKEAKRKERKKARKLGIKPKAPKDPGLPSAWPFKEELIKEFAFKQAQILAEEKRKKEEKKARRQANKSGERLPTAEEQRAAMFEEARQAAVKRKEMLKAKSETAIKRAAFAEFKQVVESSDIILMVLDARDPLACRCPEVEQYIKEANPEARIVLLLNKIDLVPREVAEAWLQLLRKELPTMPFRCSKGAEKAEKVASARNKKQAEKAAAMAAEDEVGSGPLGASTLLQLLRNHCRVSGTKEPLQVGLIGLPNVGKRSVMSSIKAFRAAQSGGSGAKEGQLDKLLTLSESTGTILAADEGEAWVPVMRNCAKVERLQDPVAPISKLLERVPSKVLMQHFKTAAFEGPEQFLKAVAQAAGKMRKGQGTPDLQAAARVVLLDWSNGRIPYYCPAPPSKASTKPPAWSKDFDAAKVMAQEPTQVMAHLRSLEDEPEPGSGQLDFFEIESAGPAKVDLAALEALAEEEEEEERSGKKARGGEDSDDFEFEDEEGEVMEEGEDEDDDEDDEGEEDEDEDGEDEDEDEDEEDEE